MSDFYFEFDSGHLHTSHQIINKLEHGRGAPNLLQLYAVGKIVLLNAACFEPTPTQGESKISPLDELLLAKEPPLKPGLYDYLDTDEWSNEAYVKYGRWLDAVVTPPDYIKSAVTERVITRAYYLGIGVPAHRIKAEKRFGTLNGFYQKMKISPRYEAGKFSDWSVDDTAEYVERIFLDLSNDNTAEKSVANEIERRASRREGPSLWIVLDKGERIMKLLGRRGYADTIGMGESDFIQLGVRFARANGGELPSEDAYDLLAKRRRTPTWRTIYNKFGSAKIYKEKVHEAYKAILDEESKRVKTIRRLSHAGQLPVDLLKDSPDNREIIARYEKWGFVNHIIPNLPPQVKLTLATLKTPEVFKASLRCYCSEGAVPLDEGTLDKTMSTLFENLDFMTYLKIP